MNASDKPHTIVEMVDDGNVMTYPATAFQVGIVKAMNALPQDRQQSVCRIAEAMIMNVVTAETITAWAKSDDPYGAFNAWWSALPEAGRSKIDAAWPAAEMPSAA